MGPVVSVSFFASGLFFGRFFEWPLQHETIFVARSLVYSARRLLADCTDCSVPLPRRLVVAAAVPDCGIDNRSCV